LENRRKPSPAADVAGETYLAPMNCEYQDHVNERRREQGFALRVGFGRYC
jgi:hypothetical protein